MKPGKHDQTELHRIVFSGLDQPMVDKAVVSFFAIPPAERDRFVARINKVMGGKGLMSLTMGKL